MSAIKGIDPKHVLAVVAVALLLVGTAFVLFPPAVAQAEQTHDPYTGEIQEDVSAGTGFEFFGVDKDGNEFKVEPKSIFAGAVWVGGTQVDNLYVNVKETYSVSGLTIDESHPLTHTVHIEIVDWVAGYPDDTYFGNEEDRASKNGYDGSLKTSWSTTTLQSGQTDWNLGKVYFASDPDQTYEHVLVGTEIASDFEGLMQYMWDYLHEGESVVDGAVIPEVRAYIDISGYRPVVSGYQEYSFQTDWSSTYSVQVDLSGEVATGSATVSVGSILTWSTTGGTDPRETHALVTPTILIAGVVLFVFAFGGNLLAEATKQSIK